ncbi:hypothetical protein PHYBLDRAFT_146627 [Phycomyces blakesleeanus NRRL 1555(-)]|uniref:Uncharacterized protein n=1 Tax=Phycomyces blakesleeanus (strain ATCC 8743b / DSM 1359 / FGSC 10004 / NBRC 33097 / NRRL 1555) TaxID=763407 RepID=A0A167MC71_PHYB8|nr:hypothetical protein PHYBLDRAFT_146627 [Phycomyces blakesleeanus NRRL 1555(-)]OAD72437.1 hypothetical protein PHYBLDRAFT_146627 [Phycomyces blakesleeanus NRRL 1555(-)]|eukprot:XP_018290477.1 hypothetical protein PHYBLDRAFT_146627 [Phycomyces blakesleeanus NRRL 1555(-)]
MIATSPCVWTQMMRTNACPDSRSYYEMAKPKLICVEGYAFKTDRLASRKTCGQSPSHPHLKRTLINMVCRLQLATGNAYTQGNKTRVEGHLRTLSFVKEKQGYFRQTYPNQYQSEVKDRHEHEHEHEKKGYRAFKHLNFQAQQAVSPSRWVGPKAHQESRLGYGIWDDRVYIMDREHQQEQVEAGRPVTGLAILQPFRGYQRELVSVGLYQKGSWCGKPRSGSSSAIRWTNPFVVDPIAASWHIVSAGSLVVYCWWSRIPPAGGQGPIRPVIEEHFAVPSLSLQMMLPIPRQVPLPIFGLSNSNNAAYSEA